MLRVLVAPLVGLVVGGAAVGTVQAAAYVGAWDPAYGSPFTTADGYPFDLGWRGEAVFDVPSGCFPGGSGYQWVDATVCGATATTAVVQLYDVANPGPTLEQLAWGAPSPYAVAPLYALLFKDNTLVGFDTDVSARHVSVQAPPASPPGLAPPIYFGLSLGFARWDNSVGSLETYDPASYNGPRLSWYGCPESECYGEGINDDSIPIEFRVTERTPPVAPIPEPGTWALLTVGMLAVAWRGRHRGRRSAAQS